MDRSVRRVSQEHPYIQVSKVDRVSSADRASSAAQVSRLAQASQVEWTSSASQDSTDSQTSQDSRGNSLRPHSRQQPVSSLRQNRMASLLGGTSSVSPMGRTSSVSLSEPNREAHMLRRSSRRRSRLSILQRQPMTRQTRRFRAQGRARPTWAPKTHRTPSTRRANRRRRSASALSVRNRRGATTAKQQFKLPCLPRAQAPAVRMTEATPVMRVAPARTAGAPPSRSQAVLTTIRRERARPLPSQARAQSESVPQLPE